MKTLTRTAAGLVVGALLLTGCGSSDSSSSSTTAAEETSTTAPSLQIDDVWARQSPMGTSAGAVYLEITSPIDDDPEATTTEAMGDDMTSTTEAMGDDTTETTEAMGDGAMTMKPVASIELPAGKTVALAPGGYHIMLLDLAEPLEVGDTFEVTLSFQIAGDRTVTAEVREG